MRSNLVTSISHPLSKRHFDLCGAQLRILVVDDNHNAAEALAAYLSFEDVECRMVFGGAEAISIGTAWLPHVIAMDISMPECTGVKAAFALRHNRRTSGITIIAVTALDETEVCRHLTAEEFDGYFQKGQSPANLLALVMTFANA